MKSVPVPDLVAVMVTGVRDVVVVAPVSVGWGGFNTTTMTFAGSPLLVGATVRVIVVALVPVAVDMVPVKVRGSVIEVVG